MDEEAFNRKLIDAVSSKTLLYNSYHPDRKHKLKQENTWKEIAASLNSTGKHYNGSACFCFSNFLRNDCYVYVFSFSDVKVHSY